MKYHTAGQLNCLVPSSFTQSRLVHLTNEKARGIRHDTYHTCSVCGVILNSVLVKKQMKIILPSSQKWQCVIGWAFPDLHMHSDSPNYHNTCQMTYVTSQEDLNCQHYQWERFISPKVWHLLSSKFNAQQPSFHRYRSATANTRKTQFKKTSKTEHLNTLYIGMSGNNFKLSSNALTYAC